MVPDQRTTLFSSKFNCLKDHGSYIKINSFTYLHVIIRKSYDDVLIRSNLINYQWYIYISTLWILYTYVVKITYHYIYIIWDYIYIKSKLK